MSLMVLHKYCNIDISPTDVRLLIKAINITTNPYKSKKENTDKAYKLFNSKNKKTSKKGYDLYNATTSGEYENFVEEIKILHSYNSAGRLELPRSQNITLYEHDPEIIIFLLTKLIASGVLDIKEKNVIYDAVLDNYLFQDGAEKLLSDIEHIAIAMKAPRIHKMGYA